jgi:hypothetical protein
VFVSVRSLGPYAAIELLLPGGSMVALLYWWYRQRASRTRDIPDCSPHFGGRASLQVMPTGRQYWHYRYRFEGREKQLSLGRYPYVPVESARARRHAARQLLEAGVDPAGQQQALRLISVDPV